jgi:peptidyl-dipeptidase A
MNRHFGVTSDVLLGILARVLQLILPTVFLTGGYLMADTSLTDRARAFVAAHEAKFLPLDRRAGLAWWNANVSGKDEDFAEKEAAQNAIDTALADPKAFAELKILKEAAAKGQIDDQVVRRCIDVLYLLYLEKQVNPDLLKKIVSKSNAVEKTFNTFRADLNGKQMTDSEVRKVLKQSLDSKERQQVWSASKVVGKKVLRDLTELVHLRNEAARQLGFKNYHAMQLFLNEQDGDELIRLFDELDELTRQPFRAAKAEIDAALAKQYGIPISDLMPWHYHDPFFQESPALFADLDAPYKNADILQLCRSFYSGIGLPIDDVLSRSDLYEKPGKSPHAFCTDIDRSGDVRVLANIVPNEYWMSTMLHELGHAVYSSKNIPARLPYVLRSESHILTTEGVAMLFEKFSKSRAWIQKMGLRLDNPREFETAARKINQNQLLIFSRWCQVMLRFEKSMYENPEQDLNKLWWDLVERYQEIRRPTGRNEPDFASKIHIVSAPVYYHNYMMGQLFASQVFDKIVKELYPNQNPNDVSFVGDSRVGAFMKQKVFAPGKLYDWRQLTRFATGADLNAKAFASEFQTR